MSDADVVIKFSVDSRPAEEGGRRVERTLDDVRNKATTAEKAMGMLGNAFKALVAGVTMSKIISELTESENASRQLERALASTGRSAQVSLDQLGRWADQLREVTGVSDEAATRLEAMLLTMRNVKTDQFQQVMMAAADVSARTGMSFEDAGKAIGRAMNQPEQAARSLRAVGIQLSEGQANLLDQMVKTGRAGEAQALIMGKLESNYGGAAKAARDTLSGALRELGNQFGDLLKFGETDITRGLRASVEGLIVLLEKVRPITDQLGYAFGGLFEMLGAGFQMASKYADLLVLAIGGVAAYIAPWYTLVAAAAGLAGVMWKNRDAVLGFVADSLEAFGGFYNGFRATLSTLGSVFDAWITALVDSFFDAGRQIGDAFSKLPGRLMDNFKSLWSGGGSKGVADLFGNVSLGGAFSQNFEIASAKIQADAATAAATNYADQDMGLGRIVERTRQLQKEQAAVLQTQTQQTQQTTRQVNNAREIGELSSEQMKLEEERRKKNAEQLAADRAAIDRLKLQLEIGDQTVAQQEVLLAIYDRQVELKKRGVDLSSQQAKAELENVRQATELKQALERANRERDAMIDPMVKGAQDIEQALTDAVGNFVENGKIQFKSLGDYAKQIFSQVVGTLIKVNLIQPIVGSILNDISPQAAERYGYTGQGGSASSSGMGGLSNIFGSMGNLLNGGLYSQTLGGIGTGVGNMLAGYGYNFVGPTQAGAIGAGAFGNMGYGALGGLGANLLGLGGGIGGTIGNVAGSLAGGAIGTQMGTILGMAGGPVGAIIGGFLGTALGGLFGNKKPTNAAAFGNISFDAGTATYSHLNKGNSEENMGILKSAFDQVLTFGQAFNQLGVGTIKGGITGIDAGVRDAQSAYVNGVKVSAGAGQFGQLAINSLKEALRQTNITDSNVKTALSKGDFTDLSKLLSDVQFAANFKTAVQALKSGYDLENDVRKQARDSVASLNEQLTGFLDNTKRLGLSVTEAQSAVKTYVDNLIAGNDVQSSMTDVEAAVVSLKAQWEAMTPVLQTAGYTAQQAAQLIQTGLNNNLAKMAADFNKSVTNEILSITNPAQLQLLNLDTWYEDMKKSAAAVGGDLVELERLYGLKRKAILESGVSDIQKAHDSIQAYITKMQLGGNSSLSDSERLMLAQQQFKAVYDTAYQTGNTSLVGDVTGAAETLRTQLRGYYASSSDYAAGEQWIVSMLQALDRRFAGNTTADQQDPVVLELQASRSEQSNGLNNVSDSIVTLAEQIADLTAKLDRLVAGQSAYGGR